MTVLISGATGTTGGEVLRQLRAADVPVRAMTRSEESAERFRDEGIDAAVADLADPATLGAALEGVDAVYVANPASPDLPAHEGALAQAAAAAGVGHLVKLSVIGASPDAPLDFARMHHAGEQAIKQAGIPWTMVRPNGFMQNTLAWADQIAGGTVYGPVIDARWSIVDARDVAGVAVAVLRDPGAHAGEAYVVTGPEPSSPREQVAILSELLGRPIEAAEVTIDQAEAAMVDADIPAWTAERLGELFGLYRDGLAEGVSPEAERLIGQAPRDYRAFARDHLAAFGG